MNPLKNKKILLTGGAGFIGSHLVDALIKEGSYVRVLDNLTNGKMENLKQHKNNRNFEFISGNVINPKDVAKTMKNIDIVFHLACLGVRHSIKYPLENHRVNAKGTLTVLAAAFKEKVDKFIYCSSSEVYGTAQTVPMSENHPTRPCTVYGASKLAGEAYARAYYTTYGLRSIIVRPFNTYGPRSHYEDAAGEMIPRAIVRALGNKPILIFGDGTQTRDFTYVEDTVRGLVKSAKSDKLIGKTLNIGSGSEISINKLAKIIKSEVGNPEVKIKHLKSRPGDVLRLYADSALFRKLTSWKPKVSLKEGIIKTIKWFKSRPEGVQYLLSCEKAINWE